VVSSSVLWLRDIRKKFEANQAAMTELHSAFQIRPIDPNRVILPMETEAATVGFECTPVVCRIPERAGTSSANVYVVFRGLLRLRSGAGTSDPITDSYSTDFAYFKATSDGIKHVLGGHFDFEKGDITHPRAHLQLSSQADMWQYVSQSFPSQSGVEISRDPMIEILNRVRVPSAQMDFLSFMVQVAADHLVDGKSPHSTRARFRSLTTACTPFVGYEVKSGHDSWECHRGPHWYPTE
jgi:hypothetical protein